MTSKIFRSTVFVAVVVLLCAIGIILGVLYGYFDNMQTSQLKDELGLAAIGTQESGLGFLQKADSEHFRLTWVDGDGRVLYDTHVDAATLENHGDRKEIKEALADGEGEDIRYSRTLMERTVYEAKLLSDGTVLRISTSQTTMMTLLVGMLHPICVVLAITFILSALLAHRMAKRIVEPLNQLDLEQPLKNDVYEEISPLLNRIHWQHNQIRLQVEELKRKSDEFNQITGSMQEGLVLLDSFGGILSINPAARKIFGAEEHCIGKDFLQIDRTSAMRSALNDAFDKGCGYARENRNGRDYQFDFSRIESNGSVIGAVVLAFDITERLGAEQMRREFSANVSHELKTPLQGIIGSAELLESGVVKREDETRFVGHIKKEASRLVSLIEDIIRLSQLDEGVELPKETVNMLELSEDVKAILEKSAADKQVTIQVTGAGFSVEGVRRMLHEVVYNLCDNAIKYNVPGGSVTICAENNCLTVSDTGIGIPAEHKDRIFERFYRVDKSHSKASGGTGLGLSIVKHAAAYHKAEIDLDSTPGKGTTITIQF